LILDEDAYRLLLAGYFIGSLFLPEDRDDMFLRNVRELPKDYTASHDRK
jgi:hypothetical protein